MVAQGRIQNILTCLSNYKNGFIQTSCALLYSIISCIQLITLKLIKFIMADINNLEDSGCFQQLHDELLTYNYSQQLSHPHEPSKSPPKRIQTVSEKPKHLLLPSEKPRIQEGNFKPPKSKQVYSKQGKIIPIGNVTFKSNFQCGSINTVEQIGSHKYKITLEKQSNSYRTSGWFYFSVEGLKGEVHFVIQGFTKSSSLYNEGMKLCYKDAKQMGKWRRGGSHICYTNTEIDQQQSKIYQLRFSHFFKTNEASCIEFAYCFPYGLKRLKNMISNLKQHIRYEALGKSFDGRDIPLLTIGNQEAEKVMILSARVHPGQTVSSFMMEGFMKELVGENQYGKFLREHFLFKIVPMINVDGVSRGNYRFSAAGYDLNRKWKNTKENAQPEIYHLKQLIRKMNKDKEVVLFIDMHGHSRKKNVFFYGCATSQNPTAKEFPYLMEKIHDAFKYQYCSFAIQKDKQGTARISMWKELKIDHIYTLESTFCGPLYGNNYLQSDYEKIGKKLCEGLSIYFYESVKKSLSKNNKNKNFSFKLLENKIFIKTKAQEQLKNNRFLLNMGNDDNSGSDSEPQKGEIAQKQRTESGIPKQQVISKQNPYYKTQPKVKNNSSKGFVKTNTKFIKKSTNEQSSRLFFENKTEESKQKNEKYEHVEIKVAHNINSFEIDTLRASSLYQKNIRVHSLSRNTYKNSKKRITNPFDVTGQVQGRPMEKMKVNLMHVRQGAQYRRVRKLAQQQNMKRETTNFDEEDCIQGLGNKKIEIEKNRTIAPRFYPFSQQRNRKTSAEMYYKRQIKNEVLSKKLSINGDELNVRCLGKQVHF